MGWIERLRARRRTRFKPFDRSALPEAPQASFEEMVDDGLMMAEGAGRLALKNRFIVQALRGEEPYDDQRAAAAAREVLYELVQEADESAELSHEERESARNRDGRSQHQHDYHRADVLNLRRREKVYAEIAKRLWELREDPEYLATFANRARDAAWGEVAEVIEQRLDREWPDIEVDAEYELARDQRMRELAEDLDLAVRRADERRAELEDPFAGFVG
ncbi:asparagine synthase [Agromyces sp. CFH 90414]|uniref:Asparagine synthase n=1 Tax=Agromyces agglutinans TaxID=2662258 RepID=A0A6I2F6K1_9MICO|nr:asparagine synthase [Agromyces agglutinans]MRG59894.1 asparagine synthase [Agromyces agglutinans]